MKSVWLLGTTFLPGTHKLGHVIVFNLYQKACGHQKIGMNDQPWTAVKILVPCPTVLPAFSCCTRFPDLAHIRDLRPSWRS